jgi:hypothetical protein
LNWDVDMMLGFGLWLRLGLNHACICMCETWCDPPP